MGGGRVVKTVDDPDYREPLRRWAAGTRAASVQAFCYAHGFDSDSHCPCGDAAVWIFLLEL